MERLPCLESEQPQDMLKVKRRANKRKPIEKILKQRHRLGEYFTLVREMRLGDGMYFFEYFRMSVERFDRLLALVDPLLRPKRVTCNTLSSGEKLAFTLRLVWWPPGELLRSFATSTRQHCTIGLRQAHVVWWSFLRKLLLLTWRHNAG
ncbi:uncharacterized protein [Dermacentor albipictus]|uniref:uncharacterized protein n=1 Tax=Dermacentor albipictus TaxID=60249 RepID=UPI0038FCBE78